jgi:hypothetical protein
VKERECLLLLRLARQAEHGRGEVRVELERLRVPGPSLLEVEAALVLEGFAPDPVGLVRRGRDRAAIRKEKGGRHAHGGEQEEGEQRNRAAFRHRTPMIRRGQVRGFRAGEPAPEFAGGKERT